VNDWTPAWLVPIIDFLASQPFLLIGALALPLLLVAWLGRCYPHKPLVILAVAPLILSLVAAFTSAVVIPLIMLDVALFAVAAFDLFTLPARRSFSARRETGRIVSLAKDHRVTLTVSNQSGHRRRIWLRDTLPEHFTSEPDTFPLTLGPRRRATVHYELNAHRRGAFELDKVYIRARSLLGLWQRYFEYEERSTLHVYPDLQQLGEYALLARTNRLSLMGVRRQRRIGQDNEFERLRIYTRDANFKHIDWRSTARRSKLTVKDFQTNQSQRLIFLVDCGRMMTNTAEGLSLLDHSLNAMLMLSHVALRQGDSVGLICFSDEIHSYVPPRGGHTQMNHLLHAAFDRFPKLVESRYDQAFLYLASHCRKRALVVLVTNVVDEVNSRQVEQYLGSLVGRHLPLGVMLRDHRLFDAAEKESLHGLDLYRAAAAADILSWRQQVITDLEHRGVLSLDVFPENMTAPLVNQYLEVKARHLL